MFSFQSHSPLADSDILVSKVKKKKKKKNKLTPKQKQLIFKRKLMAARAAQEAAAREAAIREAVAREAAQEAAAREAAAREAAAREAAQEAAREAAREAAVREAAAREAAREAAASEAAAREAAAREAAAREAAREAAAREAAAREAFREAAAQEERDFQEAIRRSEEQARAQRQAFEQQLEQLRQRATREGLVVRDVCGDGNCFFRAVAHQLNRIGFRGLVNWDHLLLRRVAVEYIRTNPGIFTPFFDAGEIEPYLQNMSHNGVWAEGPIIDALARALGLRIRILDSRGPVYQTGGPASAVQIDLGYIPDRHYVALEPSPAREARERAEREARERAEREARERAEREARERRGRPLIAVPMDQAQALGVERLGFPGPNGTILLDPHVIFGLRPGASRGEITRSYRELIFRWHPDRNNGNPIATRVTQTINDARDMLMR